MKTYNELYNLVNRVHEENFRKSLQDCLDGKANMYSLLRSAINGELHCQIKTCNGLLEEVSKIFPLKEEHRQLVADIARWQMENQEQ